MNENSYIQVRDVMTPDPKVIDGLANVRAAIELMRQNRVSSLVIDRRHDGDEYGLISVHDIAAEVIATNRSPDRVSVYEIMSKPVLTVNVAMNVKYAIRLISRFRLNRALAVEHGKMVGIVTLRDMSIRYALPEQAE